MSEQNPVTTDAPLKPIILLFVSDRCIWYFVSYIDTPIILYYLLLGGLLFFSTSDSFSSAVLACLLGASKNKTITKKIGPRTPKVGIVSRQIYRMHSPFAFPFPTSAQVHTEYGSWYKRTARGDRPYYEQYSNDTIRVKSKSNSCVIIYPSTHLFIFTYITEYVRTKKACLLFFSSFFCTCIQTRTALERFIHCSSTALVALERGIISDRRLLGLLYTLRYDVAEKHALL